jgi:hemerythrin
MVSNLFTSFDHLYSALWLDTTRTPFGERPLLAATQIKHSRINYLQSGYASNILLFMTFIPWMQKYNIGIEKIDAQHKQLVDIINELHGAIQAGSTQEVLDDFLSKLTSYTEYHFGFEEGLLKKLGCAELEEHKEKHQEFINLIEGMVGHLHNRKLNLGGMLLIFLKRWFTNHILIDDMDALSDPNRSLR